MASTNEDAVVLATARLDDGRLLIMRHLPDRGTIELGWWAPGENGPRAQQPVLELAAEAVEVEGFAQLCERVAGVDWDGIGEGAEIAAVGPFGDGAELVAVRVGDEVTVLRRPERDDRVDLPRTVVDTLRSRMLPAARQKLATLGFGLIQQSA